jgi:MauM/NapG family ferredoxin protein
LRFQRLLQISLFGLFAFLLWSAAHPLPGWLGVDLFLRLDPLLSLGSMATARAFIPKVAVALILVGLSLFMGRIFCGYVCPMGATIDFADWLGKQRRSRDNSIESGRGFRRLKYYFVLGLTGSAVAGISWIFLFSPLSLTTRFYSFVVYPLVLMVANVFLDGFRPLFPFLGLDHLSLVHLAVPRYNTNLFVALFFFAVLALGMIRPRFWCRNVCPAGAIFALCSIRPLFRRVVSETCTACGKCVRACPMGAISRDIATTAHSECITCLRCVEVCPEKAVSFKATRKVPVLTKEVDLERRKALGAGLAGIAVAAVNLTSLHHLHGSESPRPLRSSRLIRAPGSLPEPEFQGRCVRCGECVKTCLTNTLQPVWLEAGLAGLWTPKVTARLAGCEQGCTMCGEVCPTGAIRPLSLDEKLFAKIGTARIEKSRCIAWEQGKKCMICDEICPYNAISSQFVSGHAVTVPMVDENKCNGCGYCESKCPVVGEAAVVVEPLGEIRLAVGSYKDKAKELGLVFHAGAELKDEFILNSGEAREEEKKTGEKLLPPGFIVDR